MANKGLSLQNILGLLIVFIFLILLISGSSSFEEIGKKLYKWNRGSEKKSFLLNNQIALVEIDGKSLETYGPWPWPRHFIADLVNTLQDQGVRLIALQIPFFQRRPNPDRAELKAFHEKILAISSADKGSIPADRVSKGLENLEANFNHDQRLIESIRKSGRVILPAFMDRNTAPGQTQSNIMSLIMPQGLSVPEAGRNRVTRLSGAQLLLPFNDLLDAALGIGLLPLSEKRQGGAPWSHTMIAEYEGVFLPSYPLRIAAALYGLTPQEVVIKRNGLQIQGKTIPMVNWEMIYPYKQGVSTFPVFSFVDVHQGRTKLDSLKGKLVLVGFAATPSENLNRFGLPTAPNIMDTARLLIQILGKDAVSRPFFLLYVEIALLLSFGLGAVYYFPRMGLGFRTLLFVIASILLMLAGTFFYRSMDVWVRMMYPVACLIAVYILISLWLIGSRRSRRLDPHYGNRLVGQSFQKEGLLDLAFDQFRKLPLEDETKGLVYQLGLEYEEKGLVKKALSTYEYINRGGGFKDVDKRIASLKESDYSSTILLGESSQETTLHKAGAGNNRSKIGRYEILGELGKGSMGLVYQALDPKLNRRLAIKTIRFSDEFDTDIIQDIKSRFFREAEIAGRLTHPSIVTIYDVGEEGDLTYMAMEFLEGEDLTQFIAKSHLLPIREVFEIVKKIAEALEFAHKAGVIHRDIKPANIMLLKGGGIKVTDFGIAKAISSSRTKTGVILGTPNYMSPEQIMGQKIDARSDIFSLGVLFFQLLTGETPFKGDNLSSLLYQITQGKHPSLRERNPKIPGICERIIDKALAKNPQKRFKSAGEMAYVIQSLLAKIDELRERKLKSS
jgi:serine/threonine-protein kinase